jgi:hypothetical protein
MLLKNLAEAGRHLAPPRSTAYITRSGVFGGQPQEYGASGAWGPFFMLAPTEMMTSNSHLTKPLLR